ncbi:MAG: SDR family oxidoreductase [Solirubrobacteraceae bacterium]|nr:SDR family oxidoreductase [Solirubrobacteraceae bacterium]
MSGWTAEQIPDQSGRTAVVTGANSGLGLVSASELAGHGAHVVLACRNVEKGEHAAANIRERHPQASVEVRALDLSSLESIRAFADALVPEHPKLELLLNNAGIMMPPRQLTADGFELQIGTNHLGHFALTGLLLQALQAGDAARVVTVSSIEHRPGRIDFDDLQREKYSPRSAYQQSKLANVLFGLELDRRLRAAGSPLISVLAHPGYSDTNLQRTGPTGIMRGLLEVGNRIIAQDKKQGALPQLYAATMPDVEGGQFYGPKGPGEMRGKVGLVKPVSAGRDEISAERLWTVSEDLTGVTYPLPSPAAA